MEFDNDRKINRLNKTEIFFWAILVILSPLATTIISFWFMPSFSIILLFISALLFPAYLLYSRYLVVLFLFQKRYLLFAVASVAFLFFVQLLSIGIHKFLLQFSLEPQEQFYLLSGPRTIIRDCFWIILNMFLCVMFSFMKKSADEHELLGNLQKDNILIRLKYLQSQLNPHFLFNTLNSIYSLSLQKSDMAPDVIIKLADIMRYLIYECNEPKIPLDKEIAFIQNYIEIEKIRYKADVRFSVEGETKDI